MSLMQAAADVIERPLNGVVRLSYGESIDAKLAELQDFW
jgi:hypothetical protein